MARIADDHPAIKTAARKLWLNMPFDKPEYREDAERRRAQQEREDYLAAHPWAVGWPYFVPYP